MNKHLFGVVFTITSVLGAGAWLALGPLSLLDGPAPEQPTPRSQTEVELTDLVDSSDVAGFVTYTNPWSPPNVANGVVTAIAPVGMVVDNGVELYRVNDRPTIGLTGDTAAWRTMQEGDEGVDVFQLEQALSALGYNNDETMTVDETFSSATASVVELWQADLGVDETGRVDFGTVIFVPTQTRVAGVGAGVGDQTPNLALVTLSQSTRSVVFSADASLVQTLAVGDVIDVKPIGKASMAATVTKIHLNAHGDYEVTADPAPFDDSNLADTTPVKISWSTMLAEQVLTVPANALLRLDNGTYALEVPNGDLTRLVPVEMGVQSGSRIEVISDSIDAGTKVITPG